MSINKAQQILTAMNKMELQAKNTLASDNNITESAHQFSDILTKQLEYVNESHKQAEKLQEDFTLGKEVSLAEVKTAELKASLYTHGLIQFRNEVVKAYHEIMNMSI